MLAEFANVIGIIGVVIVLIAYGLLQTRKIDPKAIPFSFLNLIGSVFITYSLLYYWNLASFIIEIAWILISSYGLYEALLLYGKKRSRPKNNG